MSEPLVSCLVPTRDRPAFVSLALRWFDAQRWSNKELVVVDGGVDKVAPLVAGRNDVRWIPVDPDTTLGAQRNLAVEHARGDVMMSWDDDDWYAPDRIPRQVAALRQHRAELTALTLDHVVDLDGPRWWRVVSRAGRPCGGPALGTLAWSREAVEAGARFGPGTLGEDVAFYEACRALRLPFRVEPAQGSWVHCRHGRNTSALATDAGFGPSRPPSTFPREALSLLRAAAADQLPAAPQPTIPVPAGAVGGPRTVSVLMTAWRTAPYVGAAISSVLSQVLPPGWALELLVGVDACPETAAAVARVDDPRVVRVELAENGGTYRALNTLLSLASGDVIAVLDSDDVALPGRLAAPLEALAADPDLAWVGGQRIPVDADLRPCGPPSRFPADPGAGFRAGTSCYTSHSALTARRAVFERLGGYDDTRMGGDSDLLIRALAAGLRGQNLPGVLHWYRKRPDQLTAAPDTALGSPARAAYADELARRWRAYRAGAAPARHDPPAVTAVARVVRGSRPRCLVVLPTVPSRIAGARRVVAGLLGQEVDRVVVLLQGHPDGTVLADDPRLVHRTNPPGTGPASRLDEPVHGFDVVLYADDDLDYPEDYVRTTLAHLRRLGPGVAVSYHAHYWPVAGGSYRDARRICLWDEEARDWLVPYAGVGVSAVPAVLAPVLAGPRPPVFDREDDVWLSARLRAAGVRLVRPPTPADWLRKTPLAERPDALYRRARTDGFRARIAALAYASASFGWCAEDRRPIG